MARQWARHELRLRKGRHMDLGWQELVLILLVVVIIFGAGKLPEIGGSLGKGIREFRQATTAGLGEDTPAAVAVTIPAVTEEL